jgi:hypothetical protein
MAFQESQKLAAGIRAVVWIIIIPVVALIAFDLKREPSLEAALGLALVIALNATLYFLLLNGTAHTRIDTQGIHYKYFPFVRKWKLINWNQIKRVTIGNVSPLSDFGGWGYRFGGKKKGIILSSGKAIIIQLDTGKTFVITTRMPDQAKREIEHHVEAITDYG